MTAQKQKKLVPSRSALKCAKIHEVALILLGESTRGQPASVIFTQQVAQEKKTYGLIFTLLIAHQVYLGSTRSFIV